MNSLIVRLSLPASPLLSSEPPMFHVRCFNLGGPSGKVIGLSKINRLVDYYARRPQVQERLVLQILDDLQEILETKDVIVSVTAKHLCVSSRGIKDQSSFTTTLEYGGCFAESATRNEFLNIINNQKL